DPPFLGVTVATDVVVVVEVTAVVFDVVGADEVVVLFELQPANAKPSSNNKEIRAKRNFFMYLLS
ncbi:MAG TPA: hypothetical protein VMB24_00270, partial [Dehalococcoidales bacterium]|nr:hypothetical protein [Dehalococcoidales bacterium]